ncbi:Mrp/NBP35 family ATP-binding protein, partial [candidate division KSB1 bacterium]|nr:Mrp/NBP35 family ATP-binding protein [candidate division KSB1 bacterium]
ALKIPVLGIVENMSGLLCPHCGKLIDLFKSGGGERAAESLAVPFLGRIPIDPKIVDSGDDGFAFIYDYAKAPAGEAMQAIVNKIIAKTQEEKAV